VAWRIDQCKPAAEAGMKKLAVLFTLFAFSLYSHAVSGQQSPSAGYKPELIEFMVFTQIRHAKLWLAGSAANWELADYEIDELKEGLENAAKHVPDYKGIPVGKMIESVAMPQIESVEKAIKAKDRTLFTATYDKLTEACNTCHQSANRAFIVIQRPTGSAFPNQSFAPRRN
jgi:hypothetical protein